MLSKTWRLADGRQPASWVRVYPTICNGMPTPSSACWDCAVMAEGTTMMTRARAVTANARRRCARDHHTTSARAIRTTGRALLRMSAKSAGTTTTTAMPLLLDRILPAPARTASSTGMSAVANSEKAESLTTAKE